MGYRVDYWPMDRAMRKGTYRIGGWPVLCAVFFLCFILIVCSFWTEGREVLSRFLFPADWAAVEGALTTFQETAQTGAAPMDCVEAFCREIMAEAKVDLG